jgi:hypothetical protein
MVKRVDDLESSTSYMRDRRIARAQGIYAEAIVPALFRVQQVYAEGQTARDNQQDLHDRFVPVGR